MRRFVFRLAVVLVVATLANPVGKAEAQRVAAQKRGVDAATAFAVDDLDAIGLFNGGLTITIPLGKEYPAGPDFSYGFQAVLNSVIWDFDLVTCTEGPYSMAVPDDRFNAGHSWSVSLGRLEFVGTHWRYVSVGGSQHGLYSRLHPGFPATPVSGVYFSTSSTYYHFRHFPQSSALCSSPGECGLLSFPDGQVHEFHPRTVDGKTVYLPTRMTDRHNNWVSISYPVAGTTWDITDSHGRSHQIVFGGPAGAYRRVTSVKLARFGGGQASYSFQYDNITLERQGFVTQLCSSRNPTVPVVALSRIVFPDQSYYEMSYFETDDSNDVLSGGLASIRLRSGGEYRYTYTPIFIGSQPVESENIPAPMVPDLQRAFGVATKEVALTAGGAAHGLWSYQYVPDFSIIVPGENGVPCHRRTIVRNSSGDESVHYFSTSVAHRWSYSLPFTRCASGTYDNTPPFLSVELYDGSVDTGSKVRSIYVEYEGDSLMTGNGSNSQEHNQRLKLKRTVYHDDSDVAREIAFSDFDGLGHYRTRVETSFIATETRGYFSNFNPGNGTLIVNPETGDTTGSTFVLPAVGAPWVLDTFSEQSVTGSGSTATVEYCFDTSTGFLERMRVLAGASRGSNDIVTVTEMATGGFVASEKLYGGDDQTLTDHTYTTLCDMKLPAQPRYWTDHTYASGSLATSHAVDPCDGSQIVTLADRTIDASTGFSAASRDEAGVETAVTFDDEGRLVAIMPFQTGSTTYEYRLPTVAQPNLVPRLTVRRCPVGTSSCSDAASLSWQRFEYDGLGRVVTDRVRYPGTAGLVEDFRVRTFNAMGWKLSESVWGNASLLTTFAGHDRFGRAGTITPPGQPVVSVTYAGDRLKERRTRVRLAAGTADVYRTEIYDGWSRLIRVCEGASSAWSGSCAAPGVETTYLYDVGNRLTRVCSDREVDAGNNTTCGQIRRLVYDNRSFLIQERHPEVGILEGAGAAAVPYEIVDPDGLVEIQAADAGNDWTFRTYDAAGNVLTVDVEGSAAYDMVMAYDAAGRVTHVWEAQDGQATRLLKELSYARSNDGMDLRAGKVVLTKRHNWVRKVSPIGGTRAPEKDEDAVVSESFVYEGRDGAMSERQTRFRLDGDTYAFNTAFTYDPNGRVESITYPQCRHSEGDCPSSAPARNVVNTYNKAFLSGIAGFLDSVLYQAGGMLHQVAHANGVTTTLAINAANGLARPHQISTTAGWSTGTFSYDGSSNVTAVGALQYRYDRMQRLVSGQVQAGGVKTQTATYDVFGNMTALVTGGVTQSTPTDPETNRLEAPLGEYDGGGSLVAVDFGGERFEYSYDADGMVKSVVSTTGLARTFLYNASGDRVAQWDCASSTCGLAETEQTWTIRGPTGEVLRVYRRDGGRRWEWVADYVHRDGRPAATVSPSGTFHLHQDHVGSTRQVTNSSGAQVALHNYYPFGTEATNPAQDEVAFKFTGHERDEAGKGTLDYMGKRYCSPALGRFGSIDPAAKLTATNDPQRWNRYAYVTNNPLKYVDPDGKERAQILLDADNKALLSGEITREEFSARIRARGVGALAGTPLGFGAYAGLSKLSAATALGAGIRTGVTRLQGTFFHMGPSPRGYAIEAALGKLWPATATLPYGFKTIDRFFQGVATSVKSIDLGAKTYQRASRLTSRLNKMIDTLARFKGSTRSGKTVAASQIQQRVLELVISNTNLTAEQITAINQAIERAKALGILVKIFITE